MSAKKKLLEVILVQKRTFFKVCLYIFSFKYLYFLSKLSQTTSCHRISDSICNSDESPQKHHRDIGNGDGKKIIL